MANGRKKNRLDALESLKPVPPIEEEEISEEEILPLPEEDDLPEASPLQDIVNQLKDIQLTAPDNKRGPLADIITQLEELAALPPEDLGDEEIVEGPESEDEEDLEDELI